MRRGLWLSGSWQGRAREEVCLSLIAGPGNWARAPKEGSFYASGVLCRDSLAERDKVQCPSTSPGSLELRELILMGPIQLSLQGN